MCIRDRNNGYLFSNINAVEVSAIKDTIDFEIRITEGKLANFNKIVVEGNTKTNDHVIYRELRTKPGELYSKDKLVRTVREVGQLGFFDAEQINPQIENVDPNSGTIDVRFDLVESGASQIEFWAEIGKIAEENPELPYSFIKETLLAKAEMDNGMLSDYEFTSSSFKSIALPILITVILPMVLFQIHPHRHKRVNIE